MIRYVPLPKPRNKNSYLHLHGEVSRRIRDVAACQKLRTGLIKFVEMEKRTKSELDLEFVDDDGDSNEPCVVVEDGFTVATWTRMPSSVHWQKGCTIDSGEIPLDSDAAENLNQGFGSRLVSLRAGGVVR